MGIVNVTPDSFSDGGRNAAAERPLPMGCSSRPKGPISSMSAANRPGPVPKAWPRTRNSRRVDAGDRRPGARRPQGLRRHAQGAGDARGAQGRCRASSTTSRPCTYDPQAMEAMAEADCPVVLMHAQGDPKTMQLSPHYDDVALDVFDCAGGPHRRLRGGRHCARAAHRRSRHRLRQELPPQSRPPSPVHACSTGLALPLLMGLSRKGFIGALTGEKTGGEPRSWFGRRGLVVRPQRSAHSPGA